MSSTDEKEKGLRQVAAYLNPEQFEDLETVVQPRYGMSKSATIQALVAAEVRRIKSNHTKEQRLEDANGKLDQVLDSLAEQGAKIQRLEYQNMMLMGILWHIGKPATGVVPITAERLAEVNAVIKQYMEENL